MKKPSITLQVAALNKQTPPHTPTEKSAKFTTSTGGQVFKRTPENVTENENERCIILWDMPVYTDKETTLGYLNSLSVSTPGNLPIFLKKMLMPGGVPGGHCWN